METAILGTWKLVSVSSTSANGEQDNAPFGTNPAGFLTYTQDGRMSAMISFGGRKRLSSSDSNSAPVEEQAEAYRTFVAYAGRYELNGETVIHHVEICSIQDWVGTDLIRSFRLKGDRIVLSTPTALIDGKVQSFELIWQRLPGSS